MNSCLYECTVFHRRLSPKRHEFLYRVFYLLIDLDELDLIKRGLRLLKINRPGIYSFRENDHISHGAFSVRENITRYLKMQGIEQQVGQILLLTLPRILGYIFNPISVYFCHDSEGNPIAAVAEVGNTFGEWKPYLVLPNPNHSRVYFHTRVVKHFYVSPFSDLDLSFDFRFHLPKERLQIDIDDYRDNTPELISSLTGKRVQLSDSALLLFLLKYPLLTLQVIFGIHWQALLIWLKGLKAHRKEAEPHLQKGVHRPHKSLIKSLANAPSSCAHSEPTVTPKKQP